VFQRLFKIILFFACSITAQQSLAHASEVTDADSDIMLQAQKFASKQFLININNLRKQMDEEGMPNASTASLFSVSRFFNNALDDFYEKYNLFCSLFDHPGISAESRKRGACYVAQFLKTGTLSWQPDPLSGPITNKNYLSFFKAARYVQFMGAIYSFFCDYMGYLSNEGKFMEKSVAGFSVAEIIGREITIDSCRSKDDDLTNCDLFKRLAENRRKYDNFTKSIQTKEPHSFIDIIKLSFDKLLPKSLDVDGVFIPNEVFNFSFESDVYGTILTSIAKVPEDTEVLSVLKAILCKTEQMVYMAETRLWLLDSLWKDIISNLRWKPARKFFDVEKGFQASRPTSITEEEETAAGNRAKALLAEEAAEKAKLARGKGKKSPKPQSPTVMEGGSAGAVGKSIPGGASGAPVSAIDSYSHVVPTARGPLYKIVRGRPVLVNVGKKSGTALRSEDFPPLEKLVTGPASRQTDGQPKPSVGAVSVEPATVVPEPSVHICAPAGAGTGAGADPEVTMPVSTALATVSTTLATAPVLTQPALQPPLPPVNFVEDEGAFNAFVNNSEIPNYRKKPTVARVLGELYQQKSDESKWLYLQKVVRLILENKDLKPTGFDLEKLFTSEEIGLLLGK
jgi:hypothetical protein